MWEWCLVIPFHRENHQQLNLLEDLVSGLCTGLTALRKLEPPRTDPAVLPRLAFRTLSLSSFCLRAATHLPLLPWGPHLPSTFPTSYPEIGPSE